MEPRTENSLPPISSSEIESWTREYERTLTRLSPAQLHSLLAQVNAQLQTSTTQAAVQPLLEKLAAESQPLARYSRTDPPTPPSSAQDRGQRPSPSPQPSPLDLLAGRALLARRVAGKLVLAQAKAQARRRGAE